MRAPRDVGRVVVAEAGGTTRAVFGSILPVLSCARRHSPSTDCVKNAARGVDEWGDPPLAGGFTMRRSSALFLAFAVFAVCLCSSVAAFAATITVSRSSYNPPQIRVAVVHSQT